MSKTTRRANRLPSLIRGLPTADDLALNSPTSRTSGRSKLVFLFDVDNTLLDNDRVIADLSDYLKREVGPLRARCYWNLFERLRTRLGYADYFGALQHCRSEFPRSEE